MAGLRTLPYNTCARKKLVWDVSAVLHQWYGKHVWRPQGFECLPSSFPATLYRCQRLVTVRLMMFAGGGDKISLCDRQKAFCSVKQTPRNLQTDIKHIGPMNVWYLQRCSPTPAWKHDRILISRLHASLKLAPQHENLTWTKGFEKCEGYVRKAKWLYGRTRYAQSAAITRVRATGNSTPLLQRKLVCGMADIFAPQVSHESLASLPQSCCAPAACRKPKPWRNKRIKVWGLQF